MTHLAAVPQDAAKGIHVDRPLPDPELGALWDSIVLEELNRPEFLGGSLV